MHASSALKQAARLCLVAALITPAAHAQSDMFKPRKPKQPDRAPEQLPVAAPSDAKPLQRQRGAWSIVLAAFRGERQAEAARDMIAKVSQYKELTSIFTDVRGGGKSTVVAIGRFADPSSAEPLALLERIRAIKVDDKRPFAGAFLAPPGELTDPGQRPEFNLLRAREHFGEAARYTLQIAAYGRKDITDAGKRNATEEELKESRKAAEEAAATLRNEGELAFFFHGPRYSSVTIGVWNDKDFARQGDARSGERSTTENPALTDLRARFPHNLYNGAGIKVKSRADKEEVQASQIVKIPER